MICFAAETTVRAAVTENESKSEQILRIIQHCTFLSILSGQLYKHDTLIYQAHIYHAAIQQSKHNLLSANFTIVIQTRHRIDYKRHRIENKIPS